MKKIIAILMAILMLTIVASTTVNAKETTKTIEKSTFIGRDATFICIIMGIILAPWFIFVTMAAGLGFILQLPNYIIDAYQNNGNLIDDIGKALVIGFLNAMEAYFGENSPWADTLDGIMNLLTGHNPD